MKTQVFKILCTFCLIGLLVACGPKAAPTTAPVTSAPTTAPATSAPTTAPATSVPATATPAPVTLTYLVDDSQTSQATTKALVEAYMTLHPNVTITIENRPQGADGDNVVKTRLATGTMDDLFFYNAGSLLQALDPEESLVDLTNQPYIANIAPSFLPAVTQNGKIFGVPTGTGMGGGILYNKKVFSQLGLSVPTTWAEFEANNDKIQAAGITPVIGSFSDSWTAQLFVLADFYNVQLADPTFATDYTANKAKYATTPSALNGFNYLEEGYKKGWWQKDAATTKFEQALKLLADGKGAQYPMLSFAIPTIATDSPSELNDIGFFGQPGTDASKAGVTLWMPAGTYIPKTSKNIPAAEDFLAFIASTAGVDAQNATVAPGGPYLIKGAKMPDSIPPAVKDIAAYIDTGNTAPALEFISPIKGPNLPSICVAVATGQMTAAEGAAAYDKDVQAQAKQLGLPGW